MSVDLLDVEGPCLLRGSVDVAGSKNAFHKLIAACVLVSGRHELHRVPAADDARSLMEMARLLGADVSWHHAERTLVLDSRPVRPEPLVATLTLRSTGSFLFAGALLGRFGEAVVGPPGGDRIGARPVDRHLDAFSSLGATVEKRGTEYRLRATSLQPAEVVFEKDTVNGTANALLAAVGAPGVSVIRHASRDPDVLSLIGFLRRAGVSTEWRGSDLVVTASGPVPSASIGFDVPPDRNDAATLLVAGALCGEPIEVRGVRHAELDALVSALRRAGAELVAREDTVRIRRMDPSRSHPLQIESGPFPGFLTDWGPLVHVVMTQCPGTSAFHERVYSDRFGHLHDLMRMGADVSFGSPESGGRTYGFDEHSAAGQIAEISGPSPLHGASVRGDNLRATACLLLAALVAEGRTRVAGADHLRRGYDELIERLQGLGAVMSTGVSAG